MSERATSEGAASEGAAARPLEGAIRALLVAADQCCPAIIGQAHLIHHGAGAAPDDLARRLAELKRDAADLVAAIAAVEAALPAPGRHMGANRPGPEAIARSAGRTSKKFSNIY